MSKKKLSREEALAILRQPSPMLEDMPYKEVEIKSEEERIKVQTDAAERFANAVDRFGKVIEGIYGRSKQLNKEEE